MKRYLLVCVLLLGCESGDERIARFRRAAWTEPCRNTVTLLATTIGSPSTVECQNRQHMVRVMPATLAGEEIGSVVICECALAVPPEKP